jgi:O-antigen/teichoic acid export membrane protein
LSRRLQKKIEILTKNGLAPYYMLLMRAINMLLNFVLVVYLAKSIDQELFGTFYWLLALISIFSVLSAGGLHNFIVRKCAPAFDGNGRDDRLKVIIFGAKVFAIFYALSLLIFYILFKNDPIISGEIVPVFLLIGVLAGQNIAEGMLKACGRQLDSCWPEYVLKPILLLVLFYIVLDVVGLKFSVYIAMSIFLVASIAALFLQSFYIRNNFFRPGLAFGGCFVTYSEIYPYFFYSLLASFSGQLEIIFVGFVLGRDAVAIFKITLSLLGLVTVFRVVLESYYSRKIAVYLAARDVHSAIKLRNFLTVKVFLLMGVVFLILFTLGPGFWSGYFGNDYYKAYDLLIVFIVGNLISVIFGINAPMFLMGRGTWYLGLSMIIGLSLSLGLMLSFGQAWGLVGIVYASVSGLIANSLFLRIVWDLKIKPGYIKDGVEQL